MNVLGFSRSAEILGSRRIRRAIFERRSSLPVSAACVIANGVRETLATLVAESVAVRLIEPAIPGDDAWCAIGAGARLYGVRGPLADAAFVLRPADALALAAAVFGETPGDTRELSVLENEVVCRALGALSPCLASVCGRETSRVERLPDICGYATYFEVIVERPVSLRLGVALSREPISRASGHIRIEDLLDVAIEVGIEFARGAISAAAFMDLQPGITVPLQTKVGERALLTASGSILARGDCGALSEHHAMIVRGI